MCLEFFRKISVVHFCFLCSLLYVLSRRIEHCIRYLLLTDLMVVNDQEFSAHFDSVFGSPRVWEELRYDGETCSLNRVARLMQSGDIVGIPSKKQWQSRKPGDRPGDVINHLDRDFSATGVNTKWVTDITYVRTGEGWLYLAVVVDLYHDGWWDGR